VNKLKKGNAKLEEKLKGVLSPAVDDLQAKTRRTDEQIRKDEQEKIAKTEVNSLFVPIVKIPFDVWAERVKVEDLRLSDKEAYGLALPITQLVDYYLPKMPGIAYVWAGLVLSIVSATTPRIMLLRELRKKKAKEEKQPPAAEKPPVVDAPPV